MTTKKNMQATISETRAQLARLREQASRKTSLAYLIESEMEKSGVAWSAKGLVDKFQKIAENLASMIADDLMPMNDEVKANYGDAFANEFNEKSTAAINQALEAVKTSKEGLSNLVLKMEKIVNGEPASDMDIDPLNTDGVIGDPSMGDGAMGDDESGMGDMSADDGTGDEVPSDDMTSDDLPDLASGDSAGRKKKKFESVQNPDTVIFEAFKKKLAEGVAPRNAAVSVARQFGVDVSDVTQIVRESRLPFVSRGKSARVTKSTVAEATSQGTTGTVGTGIAPPTPAPPKQPQSTVPAAPLGIKQATQATDQPITGADNYQGDDRTTLTRMANQALMQNKPDFEVGGKKFSVAYDKTKPKGANNPITLSMQESAGPRLKRNVGETSASYMKRLSEQLQKFEK